MKEIYSHHLQNLILLPLIFLFSMTLNTHASCTPGYCENCECVYYVRTYFSESYSATLMPGLCQYNSDCGAYNAWGHWDLGFGSGDTPKNNSIMVLDKASYSSVGHIAVVDSQSKNSDGTYTLSVHESNWEAKWTVECDVNYTFYPSDSTVKRKGVGAYPVLGFIYSDEVVVTDKPDLVVKEIYLTDNRTQFYTDESLTINTRIKNEGQGDTDHDIRIKYYLSNGSNVDDDPIVSWSDDIEKEKLESGESEWENKGITTPSTPGEYNITVCADTENSVDEKDEGNNCYDDDHNPIVFEVIQRNEMPEGYFDTLNCSSIAGWARDPDTTDPISVQIYTDGPSGIGILVATITADIYRADLPYTDKNHGFSFEIPQSLKNNQIHPIYVYAIDSSGGENLLLNNSPQNLKCVSISIIISVINNIILTDDPISIKAGDVSGDNFVTLSDAIWALKIVSNFGNQSVRIESDVNNDKKIGLAEVIYILQYVSEIK